MSADDGPDGGVIEQVRAFNRFYPARIGVLGHGLLGSEYSPAEARVLDELAAHGEAVALARVRDVLRIDGGYLSRILRRLERAGLVDRQRTAADGRRVTVRLTEHGGRVAADLDARSGAQVAELLAPLPAAGRRRLVGSMAAVRELLAWPGGEVRRTPRVVLRPAGVGDYGWIVARHGECYGAEFGWDSGFELLVAGIVGGLGGPGEAVWIAELDGRRAGCVACVAEPGAPGVARLRLLLVLPWARGGGLGGALVGECLRFATAGGYRRMVLSTYGVLAAARAGYRRAGFELVARRPERAFGQELVSETWARELGSGGGAAARGRRSTNPAPASPAAAVSPNTTS